MFPLRYAFGPSPHPSLKSKTHIFGATSNEKGLSMRIGCVREIKNNEFRVGLTPDNVKSYVAAGHEVLIERGAGIGSGFTDWARASPTSSTSLRART